MTDLKPTTVRLRPEQIEALDRAAEASGRLRSEVLTEAVDHWLLMLPTGFDVQTLAVLLDRENLSDPAEAQRLVNEALFKLDRARELLGTYIDRHDTEDGDA